MSEQPEKTCAYPGCDGTSIIRITLKDGSTEDYCTIWQQWWGRGAVKVERLDGRSWRLPRPERRSK